MKKIFVLLIATLLIKVSSAQDLCQSIGWANYDGQTFAGPPTGGGNAAVIEVTTFAQLKAAVESSSASVIHVMNSMGNGYKGTTGDVLNFKSNKTVLGMKAGIVVKCSWQIKNSKNIIIRNIQIQGPGNSNSNQNWDAVNIENTQRIWVDHCIIKDGEDGNFDIVKGSDNVSVTWCIFTYSAPGVHNLSNLIGSSDSEPQSQGKLNVSYINCWWKDVTDRCPRTRYGKIHIVNCLYTHPQGFPSTAGTAAGLMANNRVENSYFDQINDPCKIIGTPATANCTPIGCKFTNCTGTTTGGSLGGLAVFTPPYEYKSWMVSPDAAKVQVESLAGNTLGDPTKCGGAVTCKATINTGGSTTFCEGASVVLTASTGASFKWLKGTAQVGTASSYTATSSGSYTVEVTNAAGCKATSTSVTVTVNALPTASITAPSTSFCTGGSVTLTANTGTGLTYQWANASGKLSGATANTYKATAAGSYTVEVTNTAGCKATSTAKTITVNALPTAQITASATSFCTGGSVTLSANTGTGLTYQWANASGKLSGATAATYTATAAGAYTVEVTNTAGCKATSTVTTISTLTLPTAQITTAATSFCTGGSVLLSANTGTGLTYQWANASGKLSGATAATYTATAAGAYTVEVTNAAGCKATSAAKTITVNALPAATITAPNTSFCTGGSVTLSANTGTGLTYQWANASGKLSGATAETYTASAAGAYTVEVTNAAGCKATSAAKTITVNALPAATITAPSTSFCTGGSVVLSANTGTGLTYQWANASGKLSGATAETYTATAAGSYTVEVTTTAGCKATSAVTTISTSTLPTAQITASATSFCTGGSITLSANTGTGLTYQWANASGKLSGATAATYTATAAGAYTVEVTNTAGCKATSAVTTISSSTLPTAQITASATSFCAGGLVTLSANTGTGLTYQWANASGKLSGATAATYTATAAGPYTVEVTTTAGCKATSAVSNISTSTLPAAQITASATSFCTGGSVILSANTGTGLTYQWANASGKLSGATAATYTATAAGAYTVEVTNTAGCKATSAVSNISLSTGAVWYADTDNDGKGDPAVSQTSCTQPTGYISVAGDACPLDATKTLPGACGCGQLETDTDGDGSPDCIDSDDDNDGVTDANDCQPLNAAITSQTNWYQDTDGDGKGDASSTLFACTQPIGYASVAGDACPTDAAKTEAGNCGCGKSETSCLDCTGTPNGTAFYDNCNICVGGTSTNTACISTAITNSTSTNIKVMPQPFDATTTIRLENQGNIQFISIFNASGALVKTLDNLNTQEITLGDDLASGLYSVIIQSEKGLYTTKIVKK